VLHHRVPELFAELASARGDGRYARILRSLGSVQLLMVCRPWMQTLVSIC